MNDYIYNIVTNLVKTNHHVNIIITDIKSYDIFNKVFMHDNFSTNFNADKPSAFKNKEISEIYFNLVKSKNARKNIVITCGKSQKYENDYVNFDIFVKMRSYKLTKIINVINEK
jgi:hypothetical protein